MARRSVTDGIQLINKKLLKAWWFDLDYGTAEIRRSDDIMLLTPGPEHTSPFIANFYAPLQEIVRHFDGYGHVGISRRDCPYLTVPNSFDEFAKPLSEEACRTKPNQGGWVMEHDALPPLEWFE
jgi:hypothetical protein